jgi:hypothetical protein
VGSIVPGPDGRIWRVTTRWLAFRPQMPKLLGPSLSATGAADSVIGLVIAVPGLIGALIFGPWYLMKWGWALLCTPFAAAGRAWFGRPVTVVALWSKPYPKTDLIGLNFPDPATRFEGTAANAAEADSMIDQAAADIVVHGKPLGLVHRSGEPLRENWTIPTSPF